MKTTYVRFGNSTLEVEPLAPRLARVVGMCIRQLTNNRIDIVNKNDLVQLSHDPDESTKMPQVTGVAFKVASRTMSKIPYFTDKQLYRLIALADFFRADMPYVPSKMGTHFIHADNIDLLGIAEAAGICKAPDAAESKPRSDLLSRIEYYPDEQMYRMISLAAVLGAEVQSTEWEEREEDEEEGGVGYVVASHAADVDLPRIADLAGISRRAAENSGEHDSDRPRPGAVPGPEWQTGGWHNR